MRMLSTWDDGVRRGMSMVDGRFSLALVDREETFADFLTLETEGVWERIHKSGDLGSIREVERGRRDGLFVWFLVFARVCVEEVMHLLITVMSMSTIS